MPVSKNPCVALTHPYCWPYVRRGAERFMSELAAHLESSGQDVVTISSAPRRRRSGENVSHKKVLCWQPDWPWLGSIRLTAAHCFAMQAPFHMHRLKPQVVFCLHYLEAAAATWSRGLSEYKLIYYVTGVPVPDHLPRIPPDRYMIRRAIAAADRVAVPSSFVREVVKAQYGREADILHVPVDTQVFRPGLAAAREPNTIFAVGAFDDERKGLAPLLRAFEKVRNVRPRTRLQVSGQVSECRMAECLAGIGAAAAAAIEFLGAGDLRDLPGLYAGAAVTVLPSLNEAYGLTLLESQACGTPVVATRHAGLPELVKDGQTGILFNPGSPDQIDDSLLASALLDGMDLSAGPLTASRCCEAADAYSWAHLGPVYRRYIEGTITAGPGSQST